MKPFFALAALFFAADAAQAAGTVQVTFVEPERFADVRDHVRTSKEHLAALERVLVEAAQPHVPDGATLRIEVTDVDLAGEVRPGPGAWDLRILTGRADWPRIALRWTLDGPAPRRGEALVQDMAYLQRVPPPLADRGLVYERRMLKDYFRAVFGKPVS